MKEAILASAIVLFAFIGIALIILQIVNTIQLKKQKSYFEKLHVTLKPGVEVMLASGLYGTVKKVTAEDVMVEISKGIEIKASRYSVKKIIE